MQSNKLQYQYGTVPTRISVQNWKLTYTRAKQFANLHEQLPVWDWEPYITIFKHTVLYRNATKEGIVTQVPYQGKRVPILVPYKCKNIGIEQNRIEQFIYPSHTSRYRENCTISLQSVALNKKTTVSSRKRNKNEKIFTF